MNLKLIRTLSVFMLTISVLHGQESLHQISFMDRTEFKVGYDGNLIWNNGISVGGEYLWKEKFNVKERRKGTKTITKQVLFNVNGVLSTNFSSQTDTGFSGWFGLIWRRTNPKGRQFSLGINPLGFYRSYLPETYEVKGDKVRKVFLAGRTFYSPSITIGFGKDRPGKKLSGRYINFNFAIKTPNNAGLTPYLSFSYGYRFKL
ncbi:hypothetical protein MWU59_07650 [Flavobacteriaceae bacterium F08102]|nr:hypothetical protein [Flavobacteriaceae bacterium F08102]